ncbi:hypothetical protein ABBQ32_007252 [Trebouxia sp. C0010 RCD-2024]
MMRTSQLFVICLSIVAIGAAELPRATSRLPRSLLQTSSSAPSVAPATIDVAGLSATDAVALLCSRNISSVAYVQALFDYYDQGGHMPPFSAPLIDTYKQANGIILGKMNLAELSTSIGSINPNIPGNNITTPLNPYNQTKIPGGSSGGSGASVAARIAPWSLCEDTGGSCRSPAIANGIFGLRPTLGCYNYSDGLLPATFTRDTVGAMGRTMGDLVLLDSVLRSSNMTSTAVGAIPDPVACAARIEPNMSLSGLRLGLPSNFGWVNPGLSSQMANLTNMALDKLTAAGVELVPFDSSSLDQAIAVSWGGGPESIGYELPDALSRYLFRHNYTDLTVTEVFEAINKPTIKSGYLPYIAYREFVRGGSDTNWVEYLSTALAFPIGFDNTGTPAGLQVAAPPGSDGLILSLGLAMEKLFGSLPPPPTVAACSGCTAHVAYVPAEFNATVAGSTPPNATETWTSYTLTFNGTCASNFLTNYGKSGPVGQGLSLVDNTGIRSTYVNSSMMPPPASVVTSG